MFLSSAHRLKCIALQHVVLCAGVDKDSGFVLAV